MSAKSYVPMEFESIMQYNLDPPASTLAMDNFRPAPPLALGDSKPADPNKPSIFDLPPELRNKIFEYLVKSSTPVKVQFGTCSLQYWNKGDWLRFSADVRIPVELFASCRMLYREAGSMFYSNNTFSLFPHFFIEHYIPSFVEVPRSFFSLLGSQAHWLRRIDLDLDHLHYIHCFRGEARLDSDFEDPESVFEEQLDLFEVTPLLRAIWRLDAEVDVSFTQRFGPRTQWDVGYYPCHASSMTRVMRSILQGQL